MTNAIATALVWIYVLGFLGLTARAGRQAGTSVWLFGVGNEPQALAAALFRVCFVLGAALPVLNAFLTNANLPWLLRPAAAGPGLGLAGLALMAAGAALALYAQHYMGSSWRIGAAEGRLGRIVDSGPFSFSRNPVFLGQILLFFGFALVSPSIAQLVVAAALALAAYLQVRTEERVLEREMGASYAQCRSRVRRWL